MSYQISLLANTVMDLKPQHRRCSRAAPVTSQSPTAFFCFAYGTNPAISPNHPTCPPTPYPHLDSPPNPHKSDTFHPSLNPNRPHCRSSSQEQEKTWIPRLRTAGAGIRSPIPIIYRSEYFSIRRPTCRDINRTLLFCSVPELPGWMVQYGSQDI